VDETRQEPAVIFDLDGTLVDSVYQHVMAWRRPLAEIELPFSVWQIHRRIGMSGDLLVDAVSREVGKPLSGAESQRARDLHDKYFADSMDTVSPLPGALPLIKQLRQADAKWTIATSGRAADAEPMLDMLGLGLDDVPLLTSADVERAKPHPQLLLAALERLGANPENTFMIGDSIWDMIAAARCGALGIGLLSGGYGPEELERAGALRVYDDAADMLYHLDEIAPRTRD